MQTEPADGKGRAVPDPVVELRNVRRTFDGGRIVALHDVCLTILSGEFVAIAGPSGCGKTSLLNLMGGLDVPDAGTVLLEGKSLSGAGPLARFRSRTVGFIFQAFHLLPSLTALENVQIPMFEMPWSRRERTVRARELLAQVGLTDRESHLPCELSGGERQRVAVARSLANTPRLLLADEPTGNLDSESSTQVIDLLAKLHRERGLTLILVTHDTDVAARADRKILMRDGQVVSNAP